MSKKIKLDLVKSEYSGPESLSYCRIVDDHIEDNGLKKEDTPTPSNLNKSTESSQTQSKYTVPDNTYLPNEFDGKFTNSFPEYYTAKYKHILDKISELSVPITKSLPHHSIVNFQPFNIRYYTDKYAVDFPLKNTPNPIFQDVRIRIHTNGIMLIALAAGNTIMQSPQKIVDINFNINKSDRSNIKLQGKRKYGAKTLHKDTIVCQVRLENDPKMYDIRVGVFGRLVEINQAVKDDPNVIKTCPTGLGYICVVLPTHPKHGKTTDDSKLLTEEEYHTLLNERNNK